jgi:peptidoglycan/xylan/chitin deacetylase (PgdA/CDA1 family)
MPPARHRGPVAMAALATGLTAAARAGLGPTSQLFGAFPYRAPTGDRTVALTFDDGPNEPWTSRLLDTLGDKGVPATFFQVGRCARRHPEVTRRVVDEGHVLGNHSESHAFSRYATQPTQRREVERGRATLHEVSGRAPLLYRPPWLCHWPWVLRGIAATGSQVVSGTFASPLELFQPRPEVLVAGAVRRARPGGIVILHDGREARGGDRRASVAAVGPLVDRLRDSGYSFTTVDRLLGVPAYATTAA